MNQYIAHDLGSFFDIKTIFWHPGYVKDYLRLFGIGEGAGGKGTSKEAKNLADMIKIYIHNEPNIQKIENLPIELIEDITDFKKFRDFDINGGGIYRMMGFFSFRLKLLQSELLFKHNWKEPPNLYMPLIYNAMLQSLGVY